MPKAHNEELAKQWSLILLPVLAANNSRHSVVHVHEKILFESCVLNNYEKIQLMGYFRSPLIVMLNTVKIMMAVLVRRFTTFASIRHP